MAGAASGELNVEVSEENGLGEDTMTAFIRVHLASILQPFAERVEELRREVDELRGATADAEARTKVKLTDHTVSIRELRKELEPLSEGVAEAKAEATRGAALNAELQELKAEISAVNGRFLTVQATSFELQHEVKAGTQHLNRMQAELAVQDKRMAKKVEDTAQELHAHIVALESAQSAAAQAVEAATRTLQEVQEEMRKLAVAAERQVRKDEASLAELRTALAGADAAAKNTERRLAETAEQLKQAKANLATLQRRTEQTQGMQAVFERRQGDSASEAAGVRLRLDGVESQISRLSKQMGGGEEPAGDLFSLVRGLCKRADEASDSIDGLDRASRAQSELIQAGDARAERLKAAQDGLQESLSDLDARSVRRCLGLEALLRQQGQSQQRDAARLESESATWREAVLARLEALDSGVARMSDSVKRNSTGLESAAGRLETLRGDLGMTNDSLTKLRSTLDLTQEYWKGLTKGIRQAHRSVAIDNELFDSAPRETGAATTLPSLAPGPLSARSSQVVPSARAR